MSRYILLAVIGVALASSYPDAATTAAYDQHKNIVYAESDGIGLVMDIFVPKAHANRLAVIDVVSGNWSSSRGKINDQERARLFDTFCARGYTVFAIRPGSLSKFTGLEMLDHLQQGIRWAQDHAAEYNVDPKKFGMVGASAGGHLACLAAVTKADNSPLAAVGVFFPPTDLIDFAGDNLDLRIDNDLSRLLGALTFNGRIADVTGEQIQEMLTQLSPARRVTGNEPPFLFIHGDADPIVPLSQSATMIDALKAKGVPTELITVAGGGHPWPTIHEEIAVMADWMDRQLIAAKSPKSTAPTSFTREFDLIYDKRQGYALTMEKVTPTENPNGAAIVMVMSGGWFSSHDATKPHDATKLPNAFKENATELLDRGYTLFYVVHGSQPKFNIREIHDQISSAVRYIRFHADDFEIDANRIGITGGSAGGHLSLMQGTKGEDNDEEGMGVAAASSRVQAVVAYYPPTDFINYGTDGIFFDPVVREVLGNNPFTHAMDFVEFDQTNLRLTKVEDKARLAEHYRFIAPAYHVTEDDAPTLLLHGDEDRLVPIQQSNLIVEKFKATGVPHRLYLKKGGDHGWAATSAEAEMIANWFDQYLAP